MSVAARKRSQFRPCIDLHGGKVKQIVGMVPYPAAATAYCKLYTYSNATVAGNIFYHYLHPPFFPPRWYSERQWPWPGHQLCGLGRASTLCRSL